MLLSKYFIYLLIKRLSLAVICHGLCGFLHGHPLIQISDEFCTAFLKECAETIIQVSPDIIGILKIKTLYHLIGTALLQSDLNPL